MKCPVLPLVAILCPVVLDAPLCAGGDFLRFAPALEPSAPRPLQAGLLKLPDLDKDPFEPGPTSSSTPVLPDRPGPAGVSHAHVIPAGAFDVFYRFGFVEHDGNRDGFHQVADRDVRGEDGFEFVPTRRTTATHRLGLGYGVTDDLTLSATLPIHSHRMHHKAGDPFGSTDFTTTSSGPGDVEITALVRLLDLEPGQLLFNTGVSLPTGSISQKDGTPRGRRLLPFEMQLGSGSPDLLLGATLLHRAQRWSAGLQGQGVVRVINNHRDYRLGSGFEFSSWFAWLWFDRLDQSVRVQFSRWNRPRGEGSSIDGNLHPAGDASGLFGWRFDLLFGLNLRLADGPSGAHQIGVEGGFPIRQRIGGPQLGRDWTVVAFWRLAL